MKKFTEKLERLFTAAAFAESGEYETAREILREEDRLQKVDRVSPTTRIRKELKGTRDKKVTVYHVRQKGGVNVKEKQLTPLLNLLFYRNWCEN